MNHGANMQIDNYKFENYNDMEDGFDGVDERDGDGCHGLPDRSDEDGSNLLLFPPPDFFRRLGFPVCFQDGGCCVCLVALAL